MANKPNIDDAYFFGDNEHIGMPQDGLTDTVSFSNDETGISFTSFVQENKRPATQTRSDDD